MGMVLNLLRGGSDMLKWAEQQVGNNLEDSKRLKDEKLKRSKSEVKPTTDGSVLIMVSEVNLTTNEDSSGRWILDTGCTFQRVCSKISQTEVLAMYSGLITKNGHLGSIG